MEVKEPEESTISHKQVNIQFWIWMNRNQKEERIQPSSRKEFNFTWSLGKENLKHSKLKENNEKAEKNNTNEATN